MRCLWYWLCFVLGRWNETDEWKDEIWLSKTNETRVQYVRKKTIHFTHVKDLVVHVIVKWIMETPK